MTPESVGDSPSMRSPSTSQTTSWPSWKARLLYFVGFSSFLCEQNDSDYRPDGRRILSNRKVLGAKVSNCDTLSQSCPVNSSGSSTHVFFCKIVVKQCSWAVFYLTIHLGVPEVWGLSNLKIKSGWHVRQANSPKTRKVKVAHKWVNIFKGPAETESRWN